MFGYFGPAGTFAHQALLTFYDGEAIPFVTVSRALNAVRSGEVEAALVPLENSVEGGVSVTLDNLATGKRLMIRREVILDVQFDLCVRPGTQLGDVRQVLTHSHAAAQTRDWLAANVPQAVVNEGGSTAGAAKEVSDPGSKYDAAVCASVAGDLYGLDHIAKNIADNPGAVTRFVLVSLPAQPPMPTGADRTTLAVYLKQDQPGALLEMLTQFSVRGVNLCRIESRPTKAGLGSYFFSIDAEGHIRDPRLAEAVLGLKRVMGDVVFLGSYPRADRVAPSVAPGFTDASFAAAKSWYGSVINPED